MKKILLTIVAAMTGMVAMATQYNDQLKVIVKTETGASTTTQDATVEVETLTGGMINFTLKNFVLKSDDGDMPVGNITIEELDLTNGANFNTFEYDDFIEIEDGDDIGETWIGPMLGTVPLTMTGKITNKKLFAAIDITMTVSGEEQQIHVEFGTEFGETKQFTDNLSVTVNETPSNQTATITMDYLMPQNGSATDYKNVNFSLKNFVLQSGEETIYVGNIALKNLELKKEAGVSYSTFAFNGDIEIEAGDDEETDWTGPLLGEIPLDLSGKVEGNKLYVKINIVMMGSTLNVDVVFGEDILNAINGVIMEQNADAQQFDLSGRRVERATKGIFVKNGKKVLR